MFLPIVLIILGAATIVAAQDNNTTLVPSFSPSAANETFTAPASAPVPERECYTNLTEVYNLVAAKDSFIVETYILCPNTTFQIGSEENGVFVDGHPHLTTRSHSIFQCGTDGKSSNNCIFTGGQFHVYHDYFTFDYENKENVVIRGITFDDADGASIALVAPGDITFIDCIFKNNQNTGVLKLFYSYAETRRLHTIASLPEEGDSNELEMFRDASATGHDRRLQGGDIIETQTVTIDGCLFENNRNGPDGTLTIDGVISVSDKSNELIVRNSIFRNNSFTNPVNGANGFAITSVPGAKLTISDVCFLDNFFIGSGVVVVEGTEQDFNSTNVYGTVDPNLTCPYASIDSNTSTTCIPYEVSSCSANTSFNVYNTPAEIPTATGDPINVVATTSGGTSIENGVTLMALLMSVVVVVAF